jgi:hypothetical protein
MPDQVDFANVGDGFRQAVDSQIRMYFENNAPGYNAFKKSTTTKPITQKGYRISTWTERPGGHTGYVPSASSFNRAKAPQTESMWIFPVPYALPMVFEGAVIRAYNVGQADAIGSLNGTLGLYTDAGTRRMDQMFFGDGTGSLAYAGGTLSGTGANQTLTCTTAAAATPGQTKGAVFLEKNQYYQAYNTTDGSVRGTFIVTTPGKTTCVVNVISGSITSGDPICDPGGYKRYMRGLGHLISGTNRDLQGLDTSVYPNFNAPIVDLVGQTVTPLVVDTAKTSLQTRNNIDDADTKLTCFLTFAQHSVLRKQGYGFSQYIRNQGDSDTVKGVQKRYEDGDTVFVRDANDDEDRLYFTKQDCFEMFEEMAFGEYKIDGLEWRNLLGDNSSGSDDWQRAIGCVANPGVTQPQASTAIIRANTANLPTQASVGIA